MIHKYKKFENSSGDRFVFVNTSCKNIPAKNNDFTKDFLKDECKMEVIGFVDELVEEDWGKIVDKCTYCILPNKYVDYLEDSGENSSAIDSGKTLLDSLSIDVNNNWVLIKYL
jgi:hypothetical protein